LEIEELKEKLSVHQTSISSLEVSYSDDREACQEIDIPGDRVNLLLLFYIATQVFVVIGKYSYWWKESRPNKTAIGEVATQCSKVCSAISELFIHT